MEKSVTTPDQYLASLPYDVRPDMERLDALIGAEMNGMSRVLWEGKFWGGSEQRIIGYGDYVYQRPGKDVVEWFMVGLASQKSYISVYVNVADDDGYLVKRFADRLGKARVGSAVLSFKAVADIDLEALRELVATARDQMP